MIALSVTQQDDFAKMETATVGADSANNDCVWCGVRIVRLSDRAVRAEDCESPCYDALGRGLTISEVEVTSEYIVGPVNHARQFPPTSAG